MARALRDRRYPFDIEQAMLGGGIYVNGYAANTRLSLNNRIEE